VDLFISLKEKGCRDHKEEGEGHKQDNKGQFCKKDKGGGFVHKLKGKGLPRS